MLRRFSWAGAGCPPEQKLSYRLWISSDWRPPGCTSLLKADFSSSQRTLPATLPLPPGDTSSSCCGPAAARAGSKGAISFAQVAPMAPRNGGAKRHFSLSPRLSLSLSLSLSLRGRPGARRSASTTTLEGLTHLPWDRSLTVTADRLKSCGPSASEMSDQIKCHGSTLYFCIERMNFD